MRISIQDPCSPLCHVTIITKPSLDIFGKHHIKFLGHHSQVCSTDTYLSDYLRPVRKGGPCAPDLLNQNIYWASPTNMDFINFPTASYAL